MEALSIDQEGHLLTSINSNPTMDKYSAVPL